MKADEMKGYLQNIGEWALDEDKIVTYKWLSKTLSVHVNTAKQLLFAFLTEQKNKSPCKVSATYLLAGKLKDQSLCVTVVDEHNLESTYENFEELTSEHIYSIQKSQAVKDFQIFFVANKSAQDSEGFGSPINCARSQLRSKDSSVRIKKDEKLEDKLPEKFKDKVKVNAEKEKTASPKKGNENSKSTSPAQETSKDKKAVGNKKGGTIANFFNNAAASKKSKPKEESPSQADKAEKSEKPEKAFVASEEKKENETGGGDEKKKNTPNTSAKKKSKSDTKPKRDSKKQKKEEQDGKKRKRIRVFSDSEGSDNESEKERSPSPMIVDEPDPEGGIVLEDKEIEEEREVTPQNKRKKRKVVDKTVMSEDGFIETKKEVVYETDSETEEKPKSSSRTEEVKDLPKRISPHKKEKPAADNSKAKVAPNSKKQSSLLSFFKKN